MQEDLAVLFCEDTVRTLETLARSFPNDTMRTVNGGLFRVSNVFNAMYKPEFLLMIESLEIVKLVKKFGRLSIRSENYDEKKAFELLENYGNDTWQWTLDAFEGQIDSDMSSVILAMVLRAWSYK